MKKLFLLLMIGMSNYLFSEETLLLLVRHGETEWNAQHLVQGQLNVPLNDLGKAQAQSLAEKIVASHPDITSIYSSDLDRAYETAQESAKKFNLKIEKTPLLREIAMGEAVGLTIQERKTIYGAGEKELDRRYPERKERWGYIHIPGAETYNQLLERGHKAITLAAKAHPGEKIALFTHGRLIKTLIMESLDSIEELPVDNCSIAYFVYSPNTSEKPIKFLKIEEPLVSQLEPSLNAKN